MPKSVFAHLIVNTLKQRAEPLATDALAYLLNGSSAASSALHALATELGAQCPANLRFRSEASMENGARPDITGLDEAGCVRLHLEAKFWAGLTSNQPLGYLTGAQAPGPGGILLFVAPAVRLATLWPELIRRLDEAGLSHQPHLDQGERGRSVIVGGQILALTSWRALLVALRDAAIGQQEYRIANDIDQLQALAEDMDTDAFFPLDAEELGEIHGRRINQYCDFVDDTHMTLLAEGLASKEGLRGGGSRNAHCRYMYLRGHPARIGFEPVLWGKHGASPLWLGLKGPEWNAQDEAFGASLLRGAGVASYSGEGWGWSYTPIRLLVGVEREAVLAAVLEHLRAIAAKLPPRQPARGAARIDPAEIENPEVSSA